MKLKPKIVLLYIITVLLLLVISISVLSLVIHDVITSEISHRLDTVITDRTSELNAYFSQITNSIDDLSNSQDITLKINELIKSEKLEDIKINSLDSMFEKYLPVIGCKDVFFIEAKDGEIVYSFRDKKSVGTSLPLGATNDNGLAKLWTKIVFSEETLFSDYTYLMNGKELVLLLGAPIYDETSHLLAVVVYSLDISRIGNILKKASGIGKMGDLYLVGQDSLMRSQSIYKEENTVLAQNIEEDTIRRFILHAIKFGKPEKEGNLKEKGYEKYTNYNGKKVMANYGFIPSLNWAVVAEISKEESAGAFHNIMKISFVVSVIFIVVVGIFAFEVGGMISRPIDALRKGTALIMRGELDHKVGLTSDDELGELSDAIDKMTTRLKNTYAGLEEKTKDYAKSLEQSERQNKMLEDTKVTMMNILEDLEMERKKLQESEEKIRAIIENAIDGIIVLESNGVIDSVNPAAERIFGYSKDELVGQNVKILVPDRNLIAEIEEEESLSKSEASDVNSWETLGRKEIFGRRQKGSLFSLDLSINEMKIGGRVMFVGIFRDITARKDSERKLVQQKRDLQKINLELDSFVYTASHDLRAPLRGIASFATFLEEDYSDKLDQEGKEYLEEIRKGADRLSALIDDLLALSRISRIKNPYENVDVNELIRSIIERIEFDVKEYNVDLVIQKDIPFVNCDKIKMGEVFLNLINNAIKFSSKSQDKKPRVEVGYKDRDKLHEFFIKDNGIGIDPEYHEKVFGIFKRLHKEEEYSGTGAGLSIVKRIVEDHDGEVWIESKLGEGAEFHFTIPKSLMEKKKLGELLVEDGIITKDQLQEKLKAQKKRT